VDWINMAGDCGNWRVAVNTVILFQLSYSVWISVPLCCSATAAVRLGVS
jgi:hypothetical protein